MTLLCERVSVYRKPILQDLTVRECPVHIFFFFQTVQEKSCFGVCLESKADVIS